ncbi:MAG TPA: DPP IV N-terminal domain-containing protein [Opitutaceae bacterium]
MLNRLRPFVAVLSLLTGYTADTHAAASTGKLDPNLAYFRDLAETRNYTLGQPVSPKITPDGRSVIFLRGGARDPVLRLYEYDVASRAERELLTPQQLLGTGEEQLSAEEKARRERQRQSLRGFTTFELSHDGARLLVTLSGRLYVIERANLKVTPLPGEGWIDPRFSPDSRFVAAARNNELHVIDLAAGSVRTLTSGASSTRSHGVAEFVAQEEMGRNEGYWWSPDSESLVYQENDETAVETRYIADPLHPETAPQAFRYPRAGTANAKVRLGLIARTGGATRWIEWDREAFPYVARVRWEKADAPLTVLVQNRAQQEQVLLAVNPADGTTRPLLRETDSAWLNLDDEAETPLWLAGGTQFLWTTERGGTWQVELRNADGTLVRTLTPADFRYRGLLAADEEAGQIYVKGSADPVEIQLWRFPLAGGPGKALTEGRGHHAAEFAKDASVHLHSFQTFEGRTGWKLVARDGTTRGSLTSVAEALPRTPTTVLLRTAGTPAFDAAVTRPRELAERGKRGKTKYPVILYVYAGPTAKRVNAVARDYLLDQWMADQGYIVARIDGRGTPWHGRDWERLVRGNFIDVALADQVAGLQALASAFPEMDLKRVGVTGWSFGGYFAAMATIRRPDVFRSGVAGAPVITWENYDTHYTERYLGLPQEAPDAYRVSNVTTYAAQLERPLLLIHGLTDDNVYAQHTLQLCDALYLAGKPYEFMPMLGTHMISDPLVRLRQQQRIMEFFQRTLR